MKNIRFTTVLFLFALFAATLAHANSRGGYDDEVATGAFDRESKTLSPYFMVLDDEDGKTEGESEKLPLKSTSVDVTVSGVIADVEIRQLYRNTGQKKLECIYVFPGSTRAAVHGMEFTIGDRKVIAKIEKKEDAKAQYEQAKAENKTAALLEQKRPNVFQMSVGHILPGDEIEVTLRYTEHLLATDKIYEFVFPTVVGPRYSNATDTDPADTWVANPYLTEGTPNPATFDIDVTVNAGLPLNFLACDTHPVKVDFTSDSSAKLALKPGSEATGDRDFILKYRLAGDKLATGLLLHEDKELGENFFLLTVQPPELVKPEDIPGRDYVFVVDVSGSMNGYPLETSKELLRNLIGSLRSTDHFNVLFFAGGSQVLSPTPLSATQANIRDAIRMLDLQNGGGATQLLPALETALALPKADATSRSVVVVTDGFVSFERKTFNLIRDNLNDANLFAFGIGSSVNRHLVEGMARAGQGEPFIVTEKKHAADEADRLRKLLASPVMANVKITFADEFEAYDIEPRTYPDVFADRPIIVFGKYRGKPTGNVEVAGVSGEEAVKLSVPISNPKTTDTNDALPYLWVRNRIATLSDTISIDENRDEITAVTNLGLTYNLLTRYTSFIAIDEVVREANGIKSETVKQPLPLPKNVSNTAVSGASTPEPTMPMLLLVVALILLFQRSRREVPSQA